jgi:Zinc knuckle
MYHPGQHMEIFVAEFEGLAMRLEAIGHGVSEQMGVVNFLNSLSEVSALSTVLSALRVIDKFSWTKATTQILLESELKGVNNSGQQRPERAMVANNRFIGTCYTCGEIGHRRSDHIDRGRHQIRHPIVVMERTVEEVMLIFAKEIVALTIVKFTEVRTKEVRVKVMRAKKVRLKEVHAKKVWATNQNSMDVAVKEVTSTVSASQMMATTIGATTGRTCHRISPP